jgi:hypothetical protein
MLCWAGTVLTVYTYNTILTCEFLSLESHNKNVPKCTNIHMKKSKLSEEG